MNRLLRFVVPFSVLAAAACANDGPRPRGFGFGGAADLAIGLKLVSGYDANMDGQITRAEVDAGLTRDFRAADKNGDGKLDPDETEAENTKRFAAYGTAASPLIDWNTDGFVDMAEFAGTTLSLFGQLDRDMNGTLSAEELALPGAGRGAQAGERGPGGGRGPGAGRGGEGGRGPRGGGP